MKLADLSLNVCVALFFAVVETAVGKQNREDKEELKVILRRDAYQNKTHLELN